MDVSDGNPGLGKRFNRILSLFNRFSLQRRIEEPIWSGCW